MKPYKIKKYKCRLVRDGYVSLPIPVEEVDDAEKAASIFMKSLRGLPHEEIHALYMNGRSRIVAFEVIGQGGSNGAGILPIDIFRPGILANARCVILAHNHPSGDPKPSFDDIQMTTHIVRVGELLGMPLLDHLVCCPETGKWESVMELAPDVHRDE